MQRLAQLRQRFWVLPACLCLAGAVLAEILLIATKNQPLSLGPFDGILYRASASGSRDLLSVIAGSLLAVTATTFSITIAVLAFTSSSYGPRLVRNFLTDRANQFVLGAFLGSFLYALLVLRSIRGDDSSLEIDVFIPQVAVNVALILAVIDIGLLVFFINHISESIQIATLSAQLRRELIETVERLYPTDSSEGPDQEGLPPRPPVPSGDTTVIHASRNGYILGLGLPKLLKIAESADATIALLVRPGDHVLEGQVVARAWPPDKISEEHAGKVDSAITIGDERTTHQDVELAMLKSAELAIRALSPGMNDPFTAANAIDDLTAGLALMAARPQPAPGRRGKSGEVRLIAPAVSLPELLRTLFADLRTYAIHSPAVLRRCLVLADKVGERAIDSHVRECLVTEVNALVSAYAHTDPWSEDLASFRREADTVMSRIAPGIGR